MFAPRPKPPGTFSSSTFRCELAAQSRGRAQGTPVRGQGVPALTSRGGVVGPGAAGGGGAPGSAACTPIPQVPEAKEEGSAHLVVPGVCFTCPLTGATLRKDQRDAHIKEAILSVSGGPVSQPPAPEVLVPEPLQRAGWHRSSVTPLPAFDALKRLCVVRGVRHSKCTRVGREKPPLGHPSWRRPLSVVSGSFQR